ncbi:MAG TPA: DUF2490 domain-containing protein, partial [Nitrosomonas nitrosa]|nr:DUF2490 domain-containing protein [Nitrosomonas nitrosa]
MQMTSKFRSINALIVSAVINLIVMNMVLADSTAEDFYTWAGFEMTGGMPANNPYLRNFRYKLFMQGRFGDSSSRFTQGLIRSGAGYAFSDKVTAWLGYDWVSTGRPLALRLFNDHAVWQQLSLKDNYSFGTAISRTRFEQHFFDIPGSADVAHFFRQMFKLSTPVHFVLPNTSLVIWNEIFANLNSTDAGIRSGFNQNRAFAGIGYDINKHLLLEIGYMNQYIHRRNNPRPDLMLHVLSVTMLLNF